MVRPAGLSSDVRRGRHLTEGARQAPLLARPSAWLSSAVTQGGGLNGRDARPGADRLEPGGRLSFLLWGQGGSPGPHLVAFRSCFELHRVACGGGGPLVGNRLVAEAWGEVGWWEGAGGARVGDPKGRVGEDLVGVCFQRAAQAWNGPSAALVEAPRSPVLGCGADK